MNLAVPWTSPGMRLGAATARWLCVAAGLTAALLGTHGAAAVDMVLLRQADFGADRAFIEALPVWERIDGTDGPGVDNDPLYYGSDHLFIGRLDLDGDGVAELFVLAAPRNICDAAGEPNACTVGIYQRLAGRWTRIAAVTALEGHRRFVMAERRRRGERSTSIGYADIARWVHDETIGAARYVTSCATSCCADSLGRDWLDASPIRRVAGPPDQFRSTEDAD